LPTKVGNSFAATAKAAAESADEMLLYDFVFLKKPLLQLLQNYKNTYSIYLHSSIEKKAK